eukprot:g22738.t1
MGPAPETRSLALQVSGPIVQLSSVGEVLSAVADRSDGRLLNLNLGVRAGLVWVSVLLQAFRAPLYFF